MGLRAHDACLKALILSTGGGKTLRPVRSALIQASWNGSKPDMIAKHIHLIEEASKEGAQIICLQELFFTQYFGVEQNPWWFEIAEEIPGPTTELLQQVARKREVVIVAPMFERADVRWYYNTAVVIDADGTILGKYRKHHIPHREGFWEKYYFAPGNVGFPVFKTRYSTIGVFIDYDRHYPEVPRVLALKGAEILFNPCTTIMSLSMYLWFLEQRSHAVTNGVFVGSINRVGVEELTNEVFYGNSYFCDPFGEILAQGSGDKDDIVIADLDLEKIRLARQMWPFFRDRRPSSYTELSDPFLG